MDSACLQGLPHFQLSSEIHIKTGVYKQKKKKKRKKSNSLLVLHHSAFRMYIITILGYRMEHKQTLHMTVLRAGRGKE